MAFRGWSHDAISFYEDLELDNTKTFWVAHKAVYEQEVLAPMRALLDVLEPEFGTARLFRPYRDTRFSADKSPYKTTIAAQLETGGYVQFSAAGLGTGAGAYHLANDQLERYRQGVDDDVAGSGLQAIVDTLVASGCTLIAHDVLKTVPRGYRKDHPRIDLLRHKGVAVWRELPASDWLGKPKAAERIAAFFRSARPLTDWLATHVGPSELPPR